MKKVLFYLILVVAQVVIAQTTEAESKLKTQNEVGDSVGIWNTKGSVSLNFSQLSLNNWAAGGLNSITFNSLFNYQFNYSKGNMSWDNSIDLGYGLIKQGDNANWLKSDDRIDIASKFGQKASDKLYYAGLVNFRSQFVPGYDSEDNSTLISNFLAPAYILAAAGIDYKSGKLSLFVAPLTYKSTIVLDDSLSAAGAFGVEAGSTIRSEMGGYIKVIFGTEIMENINYSGKLDLFSNYIKNPEFVDVNWENMLTAKVNEYISVNFMTHLIFDKDIEFAFDSNGDGNEDALESRIQFKQLFGAGLVYNFK